MGYRIATGESLASAFNRIAAEEFDQADAELRRSHDRDDAVHNARKSLKRLRALLRVMRPALPKTLARAEDRRLAAAGRELSPLRDVHVQMRTLGRLKPGHNRAAHHVLRQLRHRQFFLLRRIPAQSKAVRARLKATRKSLTARHRQKGDMNDLLDGVEHIYKKGRKALKAARQSGTAVRLHDLRKRAKALGYGLELLQDFAPKKLARAMRRCDHLTEALGEDHDLVVLKKTLRDGPGGLGPLPKRIARRRAKLQKRVFKLGPKLYDEKPQAFQKRLRRLILQGHGGAK